MPVLSELEAAIVRDPDDLASYAVLGDWYVEQGDPRGEVIATQLAADAAGTSELRRAALGVFAKHREYLLGELGSMIAADAFTWRAGFIQRAVLSHERLLIEDGSLVAASLADVVEKLLAHPSARFLVSLVVRSNDRVSWGSPVPSRRDIIDRIAAAPQPLVLRELQLGDGTYGYSRFGRIARAYPALAGLHRLVIDGEATLGDVDLPELRELVLRPSGLRRRGAHDLVEAKWPQLRSLQVDLQHYPDHIERELTALVQRSDMPHLAHLALTSYRGAGRLVEILPRTTLLPRLSSLDLSAGSLSDRDLRPMLANAEAFRHLARIDLSGTQVTPKMLERASAVLPGIVGIHRS